MQDMVAELTCLDGTMSPHELHLISTPEILLQAIATPQE
jgi:hypothetical protein